MKKDRAVPGDWNVYCDRSGKKYKRSECKKTWDGLIVHKDKWEPRHPQDFIPAVSDDVAVPDPRPVPPARFLNEDDITVEELVIHGHH